MKTYNLPLGPETIQRFLPQRRPFLFVDRVTKIVFEPRPILFAQRFITSNEAIFDGHFPKLTLWPGAMTWEGLGQTTSLLLTFLEIYKHFDKEGLSKEEFCTSLIDFEQVMLHSPNQKVPHLDLLESLQPREGMPFGVAGSVNLKFLAPVFAGCRLDYEVALTKRLAQTSHFMLKTTVDGKLVAKGTTVNVTRISSFQ